MPYPHSVSEPLLRDDTDAAQDLARDLADIAAHLKLASLLDAEVSVTEVILQALEARIVGLKKGVRLGWLLVGGWVRLRDDLLPTP